MIAPAGPPGGASPSGLRRPLRRAVAAGLVVAGAAVVGTGALASASLDRLSDAGRWVHHTSEAIGVLSGLSARVAEADAAARGYVLSGRPEYLFAYQHSRVRVAGALDRVHRLTLDNPAQRHRLASLEPLLARRLAVIDAVASARGAFGAPARGARLPDAPGLAMELETALAAIVAEEERLLEARAARERARARNAEIVVLLGTAVSLLVAGAVAGLVYYVLRLREEALAAAERDARRLQLALDATGTLGWEWERATNRLAITAGTTAPIAPPRTSARLLASVHREDRARVVAAADAALRGGAEFEVEFRVSAPGGERWMAGRAGRVADASGAAGGLVGVVTDITSRKTAQWHEVELARAEQSRALAVAGARRYRRLAEALRVSTERYRALVLASAQIVYRSTPDGTEFVAPQWCEFTGQPQEHMRDGGWSGAIHTEDAPRVVELWAAAMEQTSLYEAEYRLRHRSGGYRWVQDRAVPLRNADGAVREWVGVVADVDDRRRAHDALVQTRAELEDRVADRTIELENANFVLRGVIDENELAGAALRESEARFRDMLGTTRFVAVALDTQGRVTFCNAALLELTGRRREELMGADWFAEYIVDEGGMRAIFDATMPAGEFPPHLEAELATRTGARRLIAWDTTVLHDAAGRVTGAASIGADITDQKQYEQGLRESREAAEAARARAEESSRAKSEFLARMSHELRTPLNSVIGFSTVLLRNAAGNLSAQDVTCAERISASGRHLLGVINDILDIAKVEAGRMTVDVAPVSIGALVRSTVEQVEVQLAGRDVALRVELPPEDTELATDAGKLQQVLLNLIGNALKFTERGAVTVRAVVDPVSRAALRIDVADTGIGIPPHRLGAIFDAFEQAESGTTRRYGGTGLGLAISRSLCELMGYELTVQSRVGEGSTFSVIL